VVFVIEWDEEAPVPGMGAPFVLSAGSLSNGSYVRVCDQLRHSMGVNDADAFLVFGVVPAEEEGL